jgi:hypothetical protein
VWGPCEHGNEPSDLIKGRKFLELVEGTIGFSRTLLHKVSKLLYAKLQPSVVLCIAFE